MDDIMNAELTDILKANNIEIPVSGGDGQLHRYLLTKLSEYSYGETVPLHKVVY